MGRPESDLDAASGPEAAFAAGLRDLRARAGLPSYREMARVAHFSPSVLSSAASGSRLPSLPVTLAYVAACGGDTKAWEKRWRELVPPQDVRPTGAVRPGTPPRGVQPEHLGSRPPAQLPRLPRVFVERTDETAEGLRLLAPTRDGRTPLIISGEVGAGKSTLALHLASALLPDLPDGHLYVDLSALGTADLVPTAMTDVLRALGVPEDQVPGLPCQKVGLYRTLLAERKLLLLLDNARSERQVQPFLSTATDSVVIVTSRSRLLGVDGVHRLPLDVPGLEAATRMLAAHCGPVTPAPALLADVAELCGRLPLALGVVGRRIDGEGEPYLDRVRSGLADPGTALAQLRVGDLSVRERLADAHGTLDDEARRVLAQVAALPESEGFLTAQVVARRLDVPVERVQVQLDVLVDAGLVRRRGRRGLYEIPALSRLFPTVPTPRPAPTPLAFSARPFRRRVDWSLRPNLPINPSALLAGGVR